MQGNLLVKLGTKLFHIAGVPGRQTDNPYFVSAVRETQKWGEFSLIVMTRKFSFALHFCICSHDFYMVAGEGIVSPNLGLCLTGMVSELLLVSKEDRDPLGKARKVIRYQG
jgi:hypothetical protein